MKILHTNIGIYPERGGPPAVIANLASAQARAGHAVTVASAESVPYVAEAARRILDRIPGGELVTVRTIPIPSVFRCLAGHTRVAVTEPFDFVHIHELWNPFDALVARESRAKNIPYGVTVHGLLSPPRRRIRWLKKRFARMIFVDRMLRDAHFVQGLTTHECNEIRSLVPGIRICKVANGFSLADLSTRALSPPTGLARIRMPFVLFMSRLHFMKGVDLLVPAFEQIAHSIDNLELVIAGPNDGAQEAIESALERSSVRGRIHLVGMVDGIAKNWLLANASMFLLPSRDEGFSVAILEALASGLPAILTPHCHFPEAASAGAALEVRLEARAIADAIVSIAANPGLRDQMSEAGLKLARENYPWDRIATQIVCCYQKNMPDC